MKSEVVASMLVGVLFCAGGTTGCCSSRSDAEVRAEAVEGQKRVSQKMAAIGAAMASAPATGTAKCPATLKHDPYVITTDDEYLKRFSASGAVVAAPKDPEWDFLRSRSLRTFKPESSLAKGDMYDITSDVKLVEQRRYVIVFKDPKRKPAKVISKSEPVTYEGGEFDGMMYLFDSTTGKLLCHAPVKAESSDDVSYFDEGLLAENPEEAVTGDFGAQLTKAARAQLAQIAPNINVQIPQ